MRPDHLTHKYNSSNGHLANNMSKEAKNFQKSLRKPPKGIYLNYNELINLADSDSDLIFETLNKKIASLKEEVKLKSNWKTEDNNQRFC